MLSSLYIWFHLILKTWRGLYHRSHLTNEERETQPAVGYADDLELLCPRPPAVEMNAPVLGYTRQQCSLGEGTLVFSRTCVTLTNRILSSNVSNLWLSIQIAASLAALWNLKAQAIIRDRSLPHWQFCFRSPQLQSSWQSQVNLNVASGALKSPSNIELGLGFMDLAGYWISMSKYGLRVNLASIDF